MPSQASSRIVAILLAAAFCRPLLGQDSFSPGQTSRAGDASAAVRAPSLEPTRPIITPVSSVSGSLPQTANQKWREYDLRPYTARVTSTEHPEQAVVDWILRETGTEVWFSEPVGVLSASKDRLLVYHTEEMQGIVQGIVDRLVSSQAEAYVFGIHLCTVASPNWRARALPVLRSVTVQTPGVDAWLISKENAALLLNDLRKRVDFREQSQPQLVIHNGQSQTISSLRPRNYTRSVRLRDNALPAYELEMGQMQEGYSLQVSPLLALDERSVDLVIKCQVDQIEKLVPVNLDVPGMGGARQSVQIQVPQIVSWRLHERFRWPADQVLLLSCGVVATPTANAPTPLGIPNPFSSGGGRADALLFIESHGKASQGVVGSDRTAAGANLNNRGRY